MTRSNDPCRALNCHSATNVPRAVNGHNETFLGQRGDGVPDSDPADAVLVREVSLR